MMLKNRERLQKNMPGQSQIIKEVTNVYSWLETELAGFNQYCDACGNCCDFESFGHKLYVTTPELMYFDHYVGPQIKQMTTSICPYRVNGKCTVYPYRFAGCRIFTCKGDTEKENALCEQAISKFKSLCDEYGLPYNYVYLKVGLEMLGDNPQFKIKN